MLAIGVFWTLALRTAKAPLSIHRLQDVSEDILVLFYPRDSTPVETDAYGAAELVFYQLSQKSRNTICFVVYIDPIFILVPVCHVKLRTQSHA